MIFGDGEPFSEAAVGTSLVEKWCQIFLIKRFLITEASRGHMKIYANFGRPPSSVPGSEEDQGLEAASIPARVLYS